VSVHKGVSTTWGPTIFGNVPARFLPEPAHVPTLTFGLPQLHYVWANRRFNACEEILDTTVRRLGGDRTAIVSVRNGRRVVWRYAELRDAVCRTARGLVKLGIRPGDRVLMRMPDVPEAFVAQLAVWRLGAIIVPVSVVDAATELEFVLNDVEASAAICSSLHASELQKALAAAPSVHALIGWPDPIAESPTIDDIARGQPTEFDPYPTSAFDASGVYYTGGTTGRPKGCVQTHAAEVLGGDLNNHARGAGQESVFLTHAPLGHAFGNGEKINFPLRAGGTVVLLDRPSADDMWAAMAEFKVTTMSGAATMYRMMLANPPSRKATNNLLLTSALSSGEVLDAGAQKAWAELMPVTLRNAVGMTPMGHAFIDSNIAGKKVAPGLSVGTPLPGYEARLVTPDGLASDPGEPGRLAVRGPTGITYWINKHPGAVERSRADVVDGWSLLDDAYFRDDDGWLWFHGRLDDMIVTGGRQVAPIEVERALATHPAVAEVCVIPAPDPVRGQVVMAVVALRDATSASPALAEELQTHVKELIATYKYPRRIEFIAELPKDAVGKIQRRRLRERVGVQT
jgi:2-aminobenzoate-CoA ligase